MSSRLAFIAAAALALIPVPALAAPALDGAALSWPWALPFAGILLTIATGPLLFPHIWHAHYGKFAFGWSALTLGALALFHGIGAALAGFAHVLVADYVSFIAVLFALYVVAGGILVTGNLRGTPLTNVSLLAIGAVMASVVGTTGAAMILVRPLLRANAARAHQVHVVVFFIFLVANIGGALSPLGDPPLFVGFLHGVDFFWTAQHLWGPTAFVAGVVLAIFVVIDVVLFRREPKPFAAGPMHLRIHGLVNFVLLAGIIAAILGSAVWRPGVTFDIFGTPLELQDLLRDLAFVGFALASLWLTPEEHREANGFSFEPIREVALIFAGIFVTIIPVLAALQAGPRGGFAWLLGLVSTAQGEPIPMAYFWATGLLSAFLDNAPTYLVFFELTGGDAQALMGPQLPVLAAISMGAVYMGALTYIGNAPNFMIYAIASERGVKMPSFFGYMAWSFSILIPAFAVLSLVMLLR
jgi:Na+/H+ antiporter NhaD/arsenite permease-like protein